MTTFVTIEYIILVNPTILRSKGMRSKGMDLGAVMVVPDFQLQSEH